DRPGGTLLDALEQQRHILAREVGILLAARERELLLDDLLREYEPAVVVTGLPQVLEGAEGVEAGKERRRQALARRIQPDAGRPGEDADAVPRPDGIPVLDALHVVPHAVAVHEAPARALTDGEHPAVDVCWHTGEHVLGGRTESCGPLRTHHVVVASDAAGSDDDGCRPRLELPGDPAAASRTPGRRVGRQHGAADSHDGAVLHDEFVDPMPEGERRATRRLRRPDS